MLKRMMLCSLIALPAGKIQAENSADLRVTGRLLPGACEVSFSGTTGIQFGKINIDELNRTEETVLPMRLLNYRIVCDNPSTVTVHWQSSQNTPANYPAFYFGLGMQGNTPIGYFSMSHVLDSLLGDGQPIEGLLHDGDALTWTSMRTAPTLLHSANRYYSYGRLGTTTPTAFKTISGDLRVRAVVERADALELSNDLDLTGQAIMTVRYL